MIDFVRTNFDKSKKIETRSGDLSIVSTDTGEMLGKKFGYEGNFKLKENDNGYWLEGSLHSYYNDHIIKNERANTNDFSYAKLVLCLDYLEKEIGRKWEESKVTEIEFGFNLELKESTDEILDSIHYHKELPPTTKKNKGRYSKFFYRDTFTIKIYDKARQYRLTNNILRVEIRFKKKEFASTGIENLSDLKDKEKLEKLFHLYIKRFDELVIIDNDIYQKQINEKDNVLSKILNTNYWKYYRKQVSNVTLSKHKGRLNELLKKYELDKTKILLRQALESKFQALIESNQS